MTWPKMLMGWLQRPVGGQEAPAAPPPPKADPPAAFDAAFARTVGLEGGYVNNPADPGGETRYGVSKRSYPGEDIQNMTLARARVLYLRDFWVPAHCDEMPRSIALGLFDAAVHHGPDNALRMIQAALGVAADGRWGPVSAAALARETNLQALEARFTGARLRFMASLSRWPDFGRGWANRVATLLEQVR